MEARTNDRPNRRLEHERIIMIRFAAEGVFEQVADIEVQPKQKSARNPKPRCGIIRLVP